MEVIDLLKCLFDVVFYSEVNTKGEVTFHLSPELLRPSLNLKLNNIQSYFNNWNIEAVYHYVKVTG